MIILPFIPIVALIIQNVLSLWSVLEYQKEVADIDRQVLEKLQLKSEQNPWNFSAIHKENLVNDEC